MRSYNQVLLIGNAATEPEYHESGNGKTLLTFAVAVERNWTGKENEPKMVDFHKIVAWGKLGDLCKSLVQKGARIFISGQIFNHTFEKDGTKHYITEIHADQIELLSFKAKKDPKMAVTK